MIFFCDPIRDPVRDLVQARFCRRHLKYILPLKHNTALFFLFTTLYWIEVIQATIIIDIK